MFGLVVAGRLVQTNIRQVDATRYVFDLERPEQINHFMLFMTGETPFPDGYGATVFYTGPQTLSSSWRLLGYLANDKPSAIFRLRTGDATSLGDAGMDDGSAATVAELGISIEPLASVMEQVAASRAAPAASETQLVRASSTPSLVGLAKRLVENMFVYLSSFATTQLPPGTNVLQLLGSPEAGAAFVPLKAVSEWYSRTESKLSVDPSGEFLRVSL